MEKKKKRPSDKSGVIRKLAAKDIVPSEKKGEPTAESCEVVKFNEAGMPTLDVWLEDETVWLTQAQMAELFGCAIANVNMHLNHIYADEELEESATIKDFLIVRFEGKRRVSRTHAGTAGEP